MKQCMFICESGLPCGQPSPCTRHSLVGGNMNIEDFIKKYGTRTPKLIIEMLMLSTQDMSAYTKMTVTEMVTDLTEALERAQKGEMR